MANAKRKPNLSVVVATTEEQRMEQKRDDWLAGLPPERRWAAEHVAQSQAATIAAVVGQIKSTRAELEERHAEAIEALRAELAEQVKAQAEQHAAEVAELRGELSAANSARAAAETKLQSAIDDARTQAKAELDAALTAATEQLQAQIEKSAETLHADFRSTRVSPEQLRKQATAELGSMFQ